MENKIRFLAAALLLQLLLVAVVLLDKEPYQAFEANEPLLEFNPEEISRIDILTPDDPPLRLERGEHHWVLATLDDLPAAQPSLDKLLRKLAAMKPSWPVATTPAAASRFQVAEDQFERKLLLHQGDHGLTPIYLGTSPGFRKLHLRLEGENEIYAVDLNHYEVGTRASDWADTRLLHLEPEAIVRIQLPDVTLVRDQGRILPEGLADDEMPQEEALNKLVEQIARIDILSALSQEQKADYQQAQPLFEFSLELSSGEQRSYRLLEREHSSDYLLTSSSHDHYFTLASWAIDPIKETTREKLVQGPQPEEQAPVD